MALEDNARFIPIPQRRCRAHRSELLHSWKYPFIPQTEDKEAGRDCLGNPLVCPLTPEPSALWHRTQLTLTGPSEGMKICAKSPGSGLCVAVLGFQKLAFP